MRRLLHWEDGDRRYHRTTARRPAPWTPIILTALGVIFSVVGYFIGKMEIGETIYLHSRLSLDIGDIPAELREEILRMLEMAERTLGQEGHAEECRAKLRSREMKRNVSWGMGALAFLLAAMAEFTRSRTTRVWGGTRSRARRRSPGPEPASDETEMVGYGPAIVTRTAQAGSRAPCAMTITALVLTAASVLFFIFKLTEVGFGIDLFDLIGGFFLACLVALVVNLRVERDRARKNRFLLLVCALAIPASAFLLGSFLSLFDSFYGMKNEVLAFLSRGCFLGAAITTLLALGPWRFFRFPRWLLGLACLLTIGWVFVYACPSIVREWYGTRSGPFDLFPEGILLLSRPNPERDIQSQMLIAAAIAWLVAIVVGRARWSGPGH